MIGNHLALIDTSKPDPFRTHPLRSTRQYLILVILLLLSACNNNDNFDIATVNEAPKKSHAFNYEMQNNDGKATRTAKPGEALSFHVEILDVNGEPVTNLPVEFSIFRSLKSITTSQPSKTIKTDSQGKVVYNLTSLSDPGIQKLKIRYKYNKRLENKTYPIQVLLGEIKLGTGSPFKSGTVNIKDSVLSLNSVTTIQADIMQSGSLYRSPVRFIISSPCASQGKAFIDSPVIVENGKLETIYHDNGCGKIDKISISLDDGTTDILATGNIDVKKVDLGRVFPITVQPKHISLRQYLGNRNKNALPFAVFQVTDSYGAPLENKKINFSSTARDLGVTVSPISAVSNQQGEVTVSFRPGNQPAVVKAIAQIDGTTISAESEPLTMSSGLPFAGNSKIEIARNNIEYLEVNNVRNLVTLTLRDEMNYPVDDGTYATFFTELGRISESEATENGVITTTWSGSGSEEATDPIISLIAVTEGSELFIDNNNNTVFDKGDSLIDSPEPYIDFNGDGAIDENDFFIDLNKNSLFDIGDGQYNGVRCYESTYCSTSTSTQIMFQTQFMVSTSRTDLKFSTEKLRVPIGGKPSNLKISISDLNGNYMPEGTTVNISSNRGNLIGELFVNVPGKIQRGPFDINIKVSAESISVPISGLLTVSVTTPASIESKFTLPIDFYIEDVTTSSR